MNIDFTQHPLFSCYVVMLIASGIVLAVVTLHNEAGQSAGWRLFNAVIGAGFIGYGIYLGFFFEGGAYLIFFKALLLPVILIISSIWRGRTGAPASQK